MNEQDTIIPSTTWASETLATVKDTQHKTIDISERNVLHQLSALYTDILSIEVEKLKERINKEFYGDGHGKSVKDVITEVCLHYSVAPENVYSNSRKRQIVDARQLIHWMIHSKVVHNRLTLASIGEATGGNDHATVIHGVKQVNNRIELEREYRENVMMLCNKFGWKTRFDNGRIALIKV